MSYVQHPVLGVDPHTLSSAQRRDLLRQAKRAHTLGEISYGEYEGLFKKIKSVVKKVASPVTKVIQKVTSKGPLKAVKKVLRATTAATVAVATAGLVKPKFVGIKSKVGKKIYRTVGTATKIVGGVVLGVMAAPIIAPYLASAGSATLGGLKFVGGKLVSAPSAVMNLFKSKGIDPNTVTPEQAVQAGIETGSINQGMLDQLGNMIPAVGQAIQSYQSSQQPSVEYPGGAAYPASSAGGGIMDTLGPMLPWIGVGVVAIVVLPSLLRGRK
jgi:hypothetical protein